MQVNATNTTVEIDGLSSSTNYSVKLHTVTWCKNGSWSKTVIVSTEEGGKDTTLVGQKLVDLRSHGIVRGIGEGENNKRRKALFFSFKQHINQVLYHSHGILSRETDVRLSFCREVRISARNRPIL